VSEKYTGEKYSWFNPEARDWLRPDVENIILANPSTTHIVHRCPKCETLSSVNNSTPFGIEQLLDFMVTQFQAAEAKASMAYVAGLADRFGVPYHKPAAPTPSAGEEPWKCPGLASGGPGECSREKPCFYCNPKFQAGRP
jgi:hypothetical protein